MKGRKRSARLMAIVLFLLYLGVFVAVMARHLSMKNKTYTIFLVTKVVDDSNDFWTALIEGAVLGAGEYRVDLQVFGPEKEEDVEGQIAIIRDCIGKRPDAMLVAPSDAERTTEVLKQVADQGIKLILIDSTASERVGQGIVATNNFQAGKTIGAYTKGFVQPDSVIGMVGHVQGTSTAVDREKGMRAGLGKCQEQVKEVVFCDSSYDKAYDLTKEMLGRNPDMDIVMGMNEYSATGAARAIQELGLSGRVKLVGFDNSIEQIQFLEQGVFQAIIIQKPVNMGYLGVEQAVRALQGKMIEQNLDSGFKLITKENMYGEENQRLLFPFEGED